MSVAQALTLHTATEFEAFTKDELREHDAAFLVPLALAAFGSILDIASELDDFSLGEAEFLRDQTQKWEYAQFPNSFKSSLQQLVLEGYTAFAKADSSTRSIQRVSSQIRIELEKAATVVSDTNSDRVILRTVSDENLRSILKLATTCIEISAQFGRNFSTLPGLARELAKACGLKVAMAEKVKMRLLVALKAQLKAVEVRQETVQATVIQIKEQMFQALERIEDANRSYASSTAVNCSQTDLGFSYRHLNTRSITEFSSEDLSVSGILKSTHVLDVAERFSLLLGDEEGSVDWSEICLIQGQETTIIHRIHDFLAKEVIYLQAHQEQTIHRELLPVLSTLLDASNDIVSLSSISVEKIGQKQEEIVKKHRQEVHEAAIKIKETLAVYSSQVAIPEHGRIATSIIPSSSSVSASRYQSSVTRTSGSEYESSYTEVHTEVEEARIYFESIKTKYEQASKTVTGYQQEIVKLRAEIARVTLWNKELVAVLPQLQGIIPILERLHEQFIEISLFFENNFVALKETLHFHTHITIWADRLFDFNRIGFAGVSTFDLTRQLIWQHIMYAWRVVTIAETTADTYAEVFAWYRFDTPRVDAIDYAKLDQLFNVRSTTVQTRKEAIFSLFKLVEQFWKWTPSVVLKYRQKFFATLKERISIYESSLSFSSSTALALAVNVETSKFQYFIEGVRKRQFIETYEECDCGVKHQSQQRLGYQHRSHAQITRAITSTSVQQATATASRIEEVSLEHNEVHSTGVGSASSALVGNGVAIAGSIGGTVESAGGSVVGAVGSVSETVLGAGSTVVGTLGSFGGSVVETGASLGGAVVGAAGSFGGSVVETSTSLGENVVSMGATVGGALGLSANGSAQATARVDESKARNKRSPKSESRASSLSLRGLWE